MIQVPELSPEESRCSCEKVAVNDLAAGQEALGDVLDALLVLYRPEFQSVDLTVEVAFVLEDVLHGIDHIATENEGTGLVAGLTHLLHRFLEDAADHVSVLGQHDVLEVIQDDDQIGAALFREQIRQSQHSTNVIVVKVPIERQYFIEFGKGFLVEDEMSSLQMLFDDCGVFARGGGDGTNGSGSELLEEAADASGAEKAEFTDVETAALYPHVEQGLLDDGCRACLGSFVDADTFSAADKVGEYGRLGLAPDEVLARDVFVVNERRVHTFNIFVSMQK